MSELSFAQPLWLLTLLLLPVLIWTYKRQKKIPTLIFPLGRRLKAAAAASPWAFLRHGSFVCRLAAIVSLSLAMARPQAGRSPQKQRSEGLDMMLVVDTSKSMFAMDFVIEGARKNRLEVAKTVLQAFINQRSDDRLGLTIFGSYAFAYVPLTLDHDVLLRYLDEVEIGMAGDSTAIGDALGVAINRLKDLKAKSKLIILLTDGANQAGKTDPLAAAKAAEALGVRIYTIGIGSNGLVPFPTPLGYRQVQFEIDEKLLQDIAQTTKGQYFRATDTQTLVDIYKTIDALEKSEVEVKVYRLYDEKFAIFLWPALIFLMFELLFFTSRWRRIP